MPDFSICDRRIGPGHPPYVIAELSGNHRGELSRALALIDAAKKCGVDAVKLQTYTPDTITIDHDGPGFLLEKGPWAGRRLYELYAEASTPWEWHEALFARAAAVGLTCFSSPFDPTAVDFLERLGVQAYKVASFELVDTPLIAHIASKGKPVIMSTGMASPVEVAEALDAAEGVPVALLHCVSGYPSQPREANLPRIIDMARRFERVVGLSDHSAGTAVAVASVPLGACIIEKHLTLARADGGPDAEFSMEPHEFAALVRDVRAAWEACCVSEAASEEPSRQLRRSLYAVADIRKGETFTAENVRSIRPGYGLAPKHLTEVVGRAASRSIRRGEPLVWDMVEAAAPACPSLEAAAAAP